MSYQPSAASSPLTPPTNEWCLLTPRNLLPRTTTPLCRTRVDEKKNNSRPRPAMSCLDVMYQVYGPPQSYFAAAYSPYHPVRAGDSGEEAEGGRGAIWRMVVWGLTERKKGKGEGEGKGWRGEDLGACDGEWSRTASHLGAGLGRVRTPAAADGLRAALRAILSLRRFFRDFFFPFRRDGLHPSAAAQGSDARGLQGARGQWRELPGASLSPCAPASRPQPRDRLRADILPAPWRGAPELPSGKAGRESAGRLRRFRGLAEGEEAPAPSGRREPGPFHGHPRRQRFPARPAGTSCPRATSRRRSSCSSARPSRVPIDH